VRGRLALIAALSLAAFGLQAAPSPAPVPPKDCGFTTVKHHRYNIKADQVRCRKARKLSRRYLAGKGKPKGYSCQRYSPSQTDIAFRCTKGARTLFAIRR
jgi:hypothetical protein